MDNATSQQSEAAVAKGQLGTLVFATDDCFAACEELAKGVEFTRPAGERPYGIDAAFRDPSGNQFSLLHAAKQSVGI